MLPRFFCFFVTLVLATCAFGIAPVEIIPADFRGAIQPQVAMDSGGGVHVVFGKGSSVYYTGSKDGGATFSRPVRIAELPKLALGMRRGPRIVAGEKLISVSAISHSEGSLHSWNSSDHGVTWRETAAILNDAPGSAREGLHAMAANGSGLVAAAWLDMRNAGMEIWSAVSGDGGATWGANVRVYKSPDGHVCECCHPSVAIDSQGRIAVMFRNWLDGSRDMYLSQSADGGRSYQPAQKLGSGTWKLSGCPMDGGGLAFSASGKIVSVWRREKSAFVTDANPSDEEIIAAAAAQPILTTGSFGIAKIWQEAGGLMLKKEGAAALRLASDAMFPAAASVPGHAPIVVWESSVSGVKTILATALE